MVYHDDEIFGAQGQLLGFDSSSANQRLEYHPDEKLYEIDSRFGDRVGQNRRRRRLPNLPENHSSALYTWFGYHWSIPCSGLLE
ncbi:hypothetical protein D3C77_524630 [compost metagenome]